MDALKVFLLYQLLVACLNMEPKIHRLGLAKKSKSHLGFSSLVSATGKWPNPTWRGHVNIEPSLKRAVVSRFIFPAHWSPYDGHHCPFFVSNN